MTSESGYGRVVGKASTWSATNGTAEVIRIEMKPGEWVPPLGIHVLLCGRPDGGSLSVFDGDRADIDRVLSAAEDLADGWPRMALSERARELVDAVAAYRKGK